MTDDRGQKSGVRRQMTEVRSQKVEELRHRAGEFGRWNAEIFD